jgi:hypothetical protein
MPKIQTEYLFTIDLDFEFSVLGDTPHGIRRIARLKSGNFDGPKLTRTVLPGGGAWTLVRRDGVLDIEVRLLLETSDKSGRFLLRCRRQRGPLITVLCGLKRYLPLRICRGVALSRADRDNSKQMLTNWN